LTAGEPLYYFHGSPLTVRMHVYGRWRLFSFPALLEYVSLKGKLLDVGCGYGLWCFYLASQYPDLPVLGVDPDPIKIQIAREVNEQQQFSNLNFEFGDMLTIKNQECATISLVDVMYLIPHEQQTEIIRKAWDCLQPRGKILIKDMGYSPKWKFAWNWLEETIAVRLLGITMGRRFYFRGEDEWTKLLSSQGFSTHMVRLDSGYLHPHVLYVGEKP